jgi:hypothetical protein
MEPNDRWHGDMPLQDKSSRRRVLLHHNLTTSGPGGAVAGRPHCAQSSWHVGRCIGRAESLCWRPDQAAGGAQLYARIASLPVCNPTPTLA